MRTFTSGTGRVHELRYTPDGKGLVVDLRRNPTRQRWTGFGIRPAHELVWWDYVTGQPVRRFRLRDALDGPGGVLSAEEREHDDGSPDAHTVSFCFSPWRVATAWEWTNKEDGNCVYDADAQKCVFLSTPYKTHTARLALAPDGSALAAVTFNDMDVSGRLECWALDERKRRTEPDAGWDAWRAARIRAEREEAVDLAVDPEILVFDGRFVAAGSSGAADVQCWDTQAPLEPVESARDEPGYEHGSLRKADLLASDFAPCALALGGAEHLLAIGGDGLVVWNAGHRKPVSSAPVDTTLTALAFDGTAARLIAGTVDGNLELWDVATGSRLRSLFGGIGSITAVAFSPDGLTCAAGGENGQVVMWDVDA